MPATPPNATATSIGSRIVSLLVAGLLIVGLSAFVVVTFGRVAGVEFSPQSFRRREYVFFQVPGLQWQITPVTRTRVTNDVQTYLLNQQLVTATPSVRWDVIEVAVGARTDLGDAHLLAQYLDAWDPEQQLVWERWSRDHPELAKPFWKSVQEAACANAYVLIPQLFELAREASDPGALQQQLDQHLAEQYAELADDFAHSGQPLRAIELYQVSLQRDSTNEARAEKYKSLLQQYPPPAPAPSPVPRPATAPATRATE